MRERAHVAAGDDSASYLAHVTADQARDLDGALEATILRWLANYKLGPQFHRIEAVSEHPIISQAYEGFGTNGTDREVHDLGVETIDTLR